MTNTTLKHLEMTAIGIMSGTSLDGLDLCLALLKFDGKWHFEIIATECVPYDEKWHKALSEAHTNSDEKLKILDTDFGKYTAEKVNSFLGKFNLQKPDLLCSHGHTVFHEPAKGITLQIGSGKIIAAETEINCISDFRSLDVSLGGQGAPLVPIGDDLLFTEFEGCLNLGGFSNISFREARERRAFDICPVNTALNPLANLLGKEFDENGAISRTGNIDSYLLNSLNTLPIYADNQRPSLSREWLENVFLPIVKNTSISTEDKLRTVAEHAAQQISSVINSKIPGGEILVTGGGAKNGFLMERISALSCSKIIIPSTEIIDFKEALIFALLGVLKWNGQTNVLRSVTGAERDSCSGVENLFM